MGSFAGRAVILRVKIPCLLSGRMLQGGVPCLWVRLMSDPCFGDPIDLRIATH